MNIAHTFATYEGCGSMEPHNGGGFSLPFGYHTGICVAVTCNNLRNAELR